MKKHFFSICFGMLLGIVLVTSTGVSAAISNTITASFEKFNFIVNGETKELEADPLVYQGSTYLPVRVVSNMLGYDITYKKDSRTIELFSNDLEASVMEARTIEVVDNKLEIMEQEISALEENLRSSREQLDKRKSEVEPIIESYMKEGFTREQIETERVLGEMNSPIPAMLQMIKSLEERIADFEYQLTELNAKKAELEAQTP